ncbi:MAG: glycosyltransferase family 39 protein [Patescibacteria group bacterium]|jgi:hypothetical protein
MSSFVTRVIAYLKKNIKKFDALILISFIVVCMAINLPAYLYVKTDAAMLNVLSLDEWVFTNFLDRAWYQPLQAHNPHVFLNLDNSWGYGTLFWYVYGTIGLIPHFFMSFPAEILTMRLLSSIWLGVTIFFIYKIILLLRASRINAVLGALAILAMPAFYFYYKAFSIEFMTMAFSTASVYYLLKNPFNKRNVYFTLILLGIAVSLKISLLLFVPVFIFYLLIVYWQRSLGTFVYLMLFSALLFCGTFLISNPTLLASGKPAMVRYINVTKTIMEDNRTGHNGLFTGVNYQTWYTDIISKDFLPTSFLILSIIVFIYLGIRASKHNDHRLLFLFCLWFSYTSYIIITVHKLWNWYLFPSFVFVLIGIFTINFKELFWLKKYEKYEKMCLIIFVIVLFSINVDKIIAQYAEIAGRETSANFQNKIVAKQQFEQWLYQQNKNNLVILKTAYVYFDPTPFNGIKIYPIWGNLDETQLINYQPKLILIEKNTGSNEILQRLTTDGIFVKNVFFHYKVTFETNNFYVYERT